EDDSSKENNKNLKCPFFSPDKDLPSVDLDELRSAPHVQIIDLARVIPSSAYLSKSALGNLKNAFLAATEKNPNAIVFCNLEQIKYFSDTKPSEQDLVETRKYFLPPLDPFTSHLAPSSLPILLSIPNIILTEHFGCHFISRTPSTSALSQQQPSSSDLLCTENVSFTDLVAYPFASTQIWSKLKPNSLLLDVLLATGFVSSKTSAHLLNIIVSSAKCPLPHTPFAISASIDSLFEYPGPSKLQSWKSEIALHFCHFDSKSLISDLEKLDKPWSQKYLSGMLTTNPDVSNEFFNHLK
ncbi:hypothetical protein BB560_005207, partial [Smittium megazygosporum]